MKKKNKLSRRSLIPYLMILFLVGSSFSVEGKQVKALFIGNSYTAYNNLTTLIANLATSTGDQLVHSANTPGGYTFMQHSANATTLSLIAQGGWDYVVLQEQSQLPSFPDAQVQNEVYPFARKLDSLITAANPCAKTVFYMTWGRKNGDQSNCGFFPPLCTYVGMDSMLQLRYSIMADSNDAVISPVAKVWRYLRTNHPSLELYDADESHPSLRGSYAAACAFYTIFYGKDPTLCNYNGGLTAGDAQIIRNAAKVVVYDSLTTWYQHDPLPAAQFTYTVNGNQVNFQNSSSHADHYKWYFGDGDSSISANPTHSYTTIGNYTVQLIAERCGFTDTVTINVQMTGTAVQDLQHAGIAVYPNPAQHHVTIEAAENIKQLTVFNTLGSKIAEIHPVSGKTAHLNIESFATGVYYLQIQTENFHLQTRLLKEGQ